MTWNYLQQGIVTLLFIIEESTVNFYNIFFSNPDFRQDMAEMAKQQAVNLWVQDQSSFQCSFGQPKNAMDIINMAEKSNEDRNKFEINDDISIDHSGSFQCSFGQKIVENAKEVAIVAEKSNEEQLRKFNFEGIHENTSNQALAAPQSKYSSQIF